MTLFYYAHAVYSLDATSINQNRILIDNFLKILFSNGVADSSGYEYGIPVNLSKQLHDDHIPTLLFLINMFAYQFW